MKYKLPRMSLFFGYLITFVMVYFIAVNYYNSNMEKTEISRIPGYSINIQTVIDDNIQDDISNNLNNFRLDNAKIEITGVPVYINNPEGTYFSSAIILQDDSSYKYPIVKGEYPSYDILNSGEKIILLGYGFRNYVERIRDKDYFRINGELYRVCGYIASNTSAIYDTFIVFFINNLGETLLRSVTSQAEIGNMTISINSANEISWENLEEACEANNIELIGEIEERFFASEVKNEYIIHRDMFVVFLMIIFTGISIYYWVNERMHEFIIRRIYGVSQVTILKIILIEFLLTMAISALAGGVIIISIELLLGRFIRMTLTRLLFIYQLFSSLIVIECLISMVIPSIWLARIGKAELLRRFE